MNHDVSARIDTKFSSAFLVSGVGVRDVERTMESAVCLVAIYAIKTFWTLVITLTLFRFKSTSANRNRIGTNDLVAIIQQQEFVFGLEDDDSISPLL